MQQLKIKFGKNILYIDRKQTFAGNAYFHNRINPTQEFKNLCNELNNILPTNFYDQNGAGKRVWKRLSEEDISTITKFSKTYMIAAVKIINKCFTYKTSC